MHLRACNFQSIEIGMPIRNSKQKKQQFRAIISLWPFAEVYIYEQ